MAKTLNKMLIIGFAACLVVLPSPTNSIAGAEGLDTDETLQPHALNRSGIYALRGVDQSLTGLGVKFAVVCRSITYAYGEPQNDYRPSVRHRCFDAGRLHFYDRGEPLAGISPHATAVCSILFGQDPDALDPDSQQFYYQGAAPAAEADIYEFWHFLINNVYPHSPPDADVVTASLGSQFEDWWTRGIESLAEHHGVIAVASIGNGSNAYDPPLYPGAAANVIGVGVVDSIDNENHGTHLAHLSLVYPAHSSVGPTADGRCKPDIVASGSHLAAKSNDPYGYELTSNCSSFSTPVAAGAIGLLVQKAKQDPNLSAAVSPIGGNCVMKAILLNSAMKLLQWHKGRLQADDDHFVPLDYVQGAGMLDAVGAYNQLIAGQNGPGDVQTTGWDNNTLDKGETWSNVYRITIAEPTDKFITVTLVWNRHYTSVYPFDLLPGNDSNLRLELWAIDPDNLNKRYLLDYSDSSVDNVEHIHLQANLRYMNYEIVVSNSDIDDQQQIDKTQQYGLAWNVSENQNNNLFGLDLNADDIMNELDSAIPSENGVTSF